MMIFMTSSAKLHLCLASVSSEAFQVIEILHQIIVAAAKYIISSISGDETCGVTTQSPPTIVSAN